MKLERGVSPDNPAAVYKEGILLSRGGLLTFHVPIKFVGLFTT